MSRFKYSPEQIYIGFILLFMVEKVFSLPHISRFSSHVSFVSPTSSFSHGVGDLEPRPRTKLIYDNYSNKHFKRPRYGSFRSFQGIPTKTTSSFRESTFQGYPKEKPLIPFPTYPSVSHGNGNLISSHQHVSTFNNNYDHYNPYNIPVLPPSPYKVDSPDAESLWPEGLFITPSIPVHYGNHNTYDKVSNSGNYLDNLENSIDPYLLEGIEAVQALERIIAHGELFHHEIPHETSLLANQHLRIKNGLQPHRLGSIRNISPWFRI